ncbi:MAG: DUF4115 domain-containing protein [Desulfobacterales bacterium]|nr:DUF4115 domain-containing protein [Desulfobacterales bacterium]
MGLSLQAIFETTRVGLDNLAAVENGDYHRLPPPVYARNFIRKYARADRDRRKADPRPLRKASGKPETAAGGDGGSETLAGSRPALPFPFHEPCRRDRRPVSWFLPSSSMTRAGNRLHPFLSSESPPRQEVVPAPARGILRPRIRLRVPAQTADVRGSAPIPASESASAPAEKSILPPAAAGKTYHLVIEARELTWIRITEDRNPSYQVLLKPGDKIERMASDFFQLDIGNAGGINLTFQGKPLGSLGKPGQIIHMRLPEKESEKISP